MLGSSNLDLLWADAQGSAQTQLETKSEPKSKPEAKPEEQVSVQESNKTPEPAAEASEQFDKPQPLSRTRLPRRPPGRPADPTAQTCELRGFPKSLVQMAKQSAPEAPNVKAVAAFVYAHRDPDYECDYSDVPDDVIELAGLFDQTKQLRQVDTNVSRILSKLNQLEKDGRLERFVMTMLVMNANGLLGAHVKSGDKIDYTPPDFDIVFEQLARAAEKYWRQEDLKNGRPIR